MQGYTERQVGPVLPGAFTQTGPGPGTDTSRNVSFERLIIVVMAMFIVFLLAVAIIGGLLARSEIQDQQAAAMGFQEDAQLAMVERDDKADDLDTALADLEFSEGELVDARAEVEEIQALLEEQERLTAQAREEAARQQTTATDAEAVVEQLDAILELDHEIMLEYEYLFDAMLMMLDGVIYEDMEWFDIGYDEAMFAVDNLDQLLAERDALMAEFE